MAQSEILVVLAKKPAPLKTKTRLSQQLTAEGAAALSAYFLADTLVEAGSVDGADHLIAYDPADARDYFGEIAPKFLLMEQKGSDLGERMHLAFESLFALGYQRVVLIGSDLPHIPAHSYLEGVELLRRGADVVLGPCADGGYYLIGLTRPQPDLFGFQMSNPDVLRQTIEHADRLGLRVELLSANFDVDTFNDLIKLGNLLKIHPEIRAAATRTWMKAHSNLFDLEI